MYVREAPADCDSDAPGAQTCLSFCESEDAEVDCNDDNRTITDSSNSAISLEITEGKRYFVFVDRYGSQSDQSTTAFKLASSYGSCGENVLPQCDDSGDCEAGLECLLGFCTVSCNSTLGEESVQNAFNTVLPTFVSRLFVSMIMIAALAIHVKSMLKIPDKIGV